MRRGPFIMGESANSAGHYRKPNMQISTDDARIHFLPFIKAIPRKSGDAHAHAHPHPLLPHREREEKGERRRKEREGERERGRSLIT